MSIVLMGFQSVGKTFFGKILAKRMNLDFIDSDSLIEELYETSFEKKRSVEQIHTEHGEDYFRSMEKRVILEVDPTKEQIFALGGGSLICGFEVLDHLKKAKKRVFLKKDKLSLMKVLEEKRPSYLQRIPFDTIYEERIGYFLENCDVQLEVDHMKKEDIVESLIELVKDDK